MSRMFAIGLAVVSLISAGAAAATAQRSEPDQPSPREALEWMVLNEINSAYFTREEPMNRPALVKHVPEGVIRQVDISHDGVADWLVDYTDSGLMFCGTGGCLRSLYVSVPDGSHVLAFNDQSIDFVIARRSTETVIDMSVHQVMCEPMNDDCAYSFAWDAGLGRLVERPNVRGETLLSSSFGVVAPAAGGEPRPPEGAPEVLQSRWRETVQACPSAASEGAFNIVHADIRSIPDLDGDGVRDWLYEDPYGCARPDGTVGDPKPFMIYLARADGGAELAFTSEPGERPVYDIATRPAVLISNPECGLDVPCRDARLQWDAGAARFLPTGPGGKDGSG